MTAPDQASLPLLAPPVGPDGPLVPVRMVNEWVYCPRLAYLMWVDGEWADTGDTADGRRVHARADAGGGALPNPETDVAEPPPFEARGVTLSSDRLGIIAKMDVIRGEGDAASPIEIKRGARPHLARGAYDPERVQVCAQALVLEDNGFTVNDAAIWYAASRERVAIALDHELRDMTERAISDLRLAAAARRRPPPLENSPKCPRCALAGICLPDEVGFFRKGLPPRPLNPADDPALPLHVQNPRARLRKSAETLRIEVEEGESATVALNDVSEVALYGPVSVTTPALHELMRRGIPVSWHSTGGWLMGHTVSTKSTGAALRAAQVRRADDPLFSRRAAAGMVEAKIRNQRTMLRRNWKRGDLAERDDALARLKRLAEAVREAPETSRLLGFEGEAAAIYFRHFDCMISDDRAALPAFAFDKRNRRPPADPVNAMLSFAYAVAARLFSGALALTGLETGIGFLHRPRPGRPALALDMMEPFRPILCDSVVLTLINNGEVAPGDFVTIGPSCALTPKGRKALITAWERRLDQETTHPVFGYRLSLRRLIAVQCRLLARLIEGEIPELPHYVPR
jgi:CRISPR-associated endonuclease Cas1/CRISPR-associated protein Cas4